MSVTVLRRPTVSSGGNTFRFNSIALPTISELERRDFTWNQVNNNAGKVQAQFNGIDLTTSFAVGDDVYAKSLAGSPYDGFTTVTAVSFSGGNTLVTLDITYVSTSTSGFVNNETLKPGYYLEVRFFNAVGAVLLTDAIQEVSPTAKGRMIVDISEFAKSFLSPDFENITPSFAITQDALAAKEIYIGYREVWIGSQELETADFNSFLVVLGAQQLPLLNGSNYGITASRYNIVQNAAAEIDAKFLTTKSRLKVWREWPFTLSALFSDVGGDGVAVTVTGTQSLSTQTSTPNYNTSDVDEMIRLNIGNINWALVANDNSITLTLSGPDVIVDIDADILEPCKNPVLLLFRNSLGGDSWQMFDYNQEYEYVNDNDTKVKVMLLGVTGLTSEEWEELNDMITYGAELKENIVEILPTTNKTKSRAYQQVYKVDQNGTLTGVIVKPTINQSMTKKIKHTFEVEIEFPEHFLP